VITDPVEAVVYLREAMRRDTDLKRVVTALVERTGSVDVYDWAENHPDMVVALAEGQRIVDEETGKQELELRTGTVVDPWANLS
jgi:hypothetical protein